MAAERPTDKQLNSFNRDRLRNRMVDELVGLAKGIVADEELSNGELEILVRWLVAHREITDDPIVASLYRRIQAMLSDGKFDDEERQELLDVLKEFASPRRPERGEPILSTAIPFTSPAPMLGFAGWRYCFTGSFGFGTRADCEAQVIARGAAAGSLTKLTDALVVGEYATESWLHSAYGLKIMKASGMREKGHHIAIVPEAHWLEHLRP